MALNPTRPASSIRLSTSPTSLASPRLLRFTPVIRLSWLALGGYTYEGIEKLALWYGRLGWFSSGCQVVGR